MTKKTRANRQKPSRADQQIAVLSEFSIGAFSELDNIKRMSQELCERYFAWHKENNRSLMNLEIARYDEAFNNAGNMPLDEAVAHLQSRQRPRKVFFSKKDAKTADRVVAWIKCGNEAEKAISSAIEVFLAQLQTYSDAITALSPKPGERKDIDTLFSAVAALICPLDGEISRKIAINEILLNQLRADVPRTMMEQVAENALMMAGGGRSDTQIAEILRRVFPEWAATANSVAAQNLGGDLASMKDKYFEIEVMRLLTERVRKMRKERAAPSGREVRGGRRTWREKVPRNILADASNAAPGGRRVK